MKELAQKNTYYFLKITYFVRYAGDAFFYTFLYVYLGSLGFNTGEIGLISALVPLAALLGSVVFERLAKNVNINKNLMLFISVFEIGIAILFAALRVKSYLFYLLLIPFVGFFNGPFYTLLDGYSGTYILQAKKQYSNMRIMGTLSYVVAPLLGAFLMDKGFLNYSGLFALAALFMAVGFFLIIYLPKSTITSETTLEEKLVIKEHPDFVIHLLFTFLVVALAFVSDNFFALYLTKVRGMSESVFGYIMSATIFVEFLVFVFIIYKKNMFHNPLFSYFLVGITMLARPLAVSLALPNALIWVFSLLRGVGWGYYLVFNVLFIARLAPIQKLTSALFISSIVMTAGRIIASIALGELLKVFPYENVFIAVSLFIVGGTALSMTLSYHLNKRKPRA